MKRIAVTLGFLTVLTLLVAGNAFAMVGAEPPPEGMLGITAIQEPAIEPAPDPGAVKPEPKADKAVDPAAAGTAPLDPDAPVHYATTSVKEKEQTTTPDSRDAQSSAGIEAMAPLGPGAEKGEVMEATAVKAEASQGTGANKGISAGPIYTAALVAIALGSLIGLLAFRRQIQKA